jgi:hypothetical protein
VPFFKTGKLLRERLNGQGIGVEEEPEEEAPRRVSEGA